MFEQTFKNLDDVLREEAGCSSELDYIEQSSWLLFLKYLDDLEQEYEAEAALEATIITRYSMMRFAGQHGQHQKPPTANVIIIKH
jgi:hypothetical protein